MKIIFTIILATIITTNVFAQAPQKMSSQAVIRNASNILVTNHAVGMKVSILQGSANGTNVYTETQTTTTNSNGLATIEIGVGMRVSGTFGSINWANGPYFIKTETDPSGGSSYSIIGTSELMSVPYALFSANSTPGPQGIQGAPGYTGAVGNQGSMGLTGPIGLTGGIGLPGIQGPTGLTGPLGLAGAIGLPGIQGTMGLQGPQGLSGANGIPGIQGTMGLTGPIGTPGVQGIMGAQGNEGKRGISISWLGTLTSAPVNATQNQAYYNSLDKKTYLYDGILWQLMIQDGAIGATGLAGTTGVQGPMGLTGATGPIGATGGVVNANWSATTGDAQILNKPNFATVATSGNYNDLANKPIILDETWAATTGNFTGNMNNNKIFNLASPTNANDATTKAYVDLLNARIVQLEEMVTTGGLFRLKDYEGNEYKTIKIGNQLWMAENLKSTKYADGVLIPDVIAFNNDETNVSKYGLLYTWEAANCSNAPTTTSPDLCPTGWHLPSDDEWHTLVLYLDPTAQLEQQIESSTAGGQLKETGTLNWPAPNNASNKSGFSALPNGMSYFGNFSDLNSGTFWTSTFVLKDGQMNAWNRGLGNSHTNIIRQALPQIFSCGIRCVKD